MSTKHTRRKPMARSIALVALLALLAAGAVVFVPGVRSQVRAIVRPEPPPQITPLALTLPRREQTNAARPSIRSAPGALPSDTRRPAAAPAAPGHRRRPHLRRLHSGCQQGAAVLQVFLRVRCGLGDLADLRHRHER